MGHTHEVPSCMPWSSTHQLRVDRLWIEEDRSCGDRRRHILRRWDVDRPFGSACSHGECTGRSCTIGRCSGRQQRTGNQRARIRRRSGRRPTCFGSCRSRWWGRGTCKSRIRFERFRRASRLGSRRNRWRCRTRRSSRRWRFFGPYVRIWCSRQHRRRQFDRHGRRWWQPARKHWQRIGVQWPILRWVAGFWPARRFAKQNPVGSCDTCR
jgi:hypothetical protein